MTPAKVVRSLWCAKVCVFYASSKKVGDHVLAMRKHSGIWKAGVSKEGPGYVAFRWTLFCISEGIVRFYSCTPYMLLHTGRPERFKQALQMQSGRYSHRFESWNYRTKLRRCQRLFAGPIQSALDSVTLQDSFAAYVYRNPCTSS